MSLKNNIETEIIRERKRLASSPSFLDEPTGIGSVRFVVTCESQADKILSLAKNVLSIVSKAYESNWPNLATWKKILPNDFVNNCAPEISKEEMDERIAYRKSLPWEEQQNLIANEKWSLDNWLYWLEPTNRTWFWWDATFLDETLKDTHFIVAVVVLEWPFPWGALKWLFKGCGALDIVAEDDL